MKNVKIEMVENYDSWSGIWYEAKVYVDEVYVGGGEYGGEPEDNSRWRDYAWVEKVIQSLAQNLGANVHIIEVEGKDE